MDWLVEGMQEGRGWFYLSDPGNEGIQAIFCQVAALPQARATIISVVIGAKQHKQSRH